MIRVIAFLSIIFLASCSSTKTASTDKVKAPTVDVPAIPRPPAPPLDRTKPPVPGPAPEIKLGDYQYFELDNGLKVYVVENDKLPRVSYSMRIDRDPIFDGDKTGYVAFMGQLMSRGTTSRSKAEIDEAIDFIGASLTTTSSGMFGSSLTKHSQEVLTIMRDVLMNPSFPQEELDKLRKIAMSDLAADKDDPTAIVGNIRSLVLYGAEHPYGEMLSEEKLNKITRKDIVDFYNKYWSPKKAYMAVIGDITLEEARKNVESFFGDWKGEDIPEHDYKNPTPPEKTTVILVDRPQSVQSEIRISYPVNYKTGDSDYFAGRLMNAILGGGFSSRLMQNLREDKAYTYGAGSGLSTDELIGRFSAGASVRNEVTDSAIHEFLYEMRNIADNGVTDEELAALKAYQTGSFARSLESPQTIAGFAINSAIKNLPSDFYQNYLKNLNAVTIEEVNVAAKKFIKADNAYIIVVGKASEIEEKLKVFGPIVQYDADGNIVDKGKLNAAIAGVSAQAIIDKYIAAIGGKEKLALVKSQRQEWAIPAFGATIETTTTADGKFRTDVMMQGSVQQSVISDGKSVVSLMAGHKMPSDPRADEADMINNRLFAELYYPSSGVQLKVSGIEKVNGKEAYIVSIIFPSGSESQAYFDVESGLKVKEVSNKDTEQGVVTQISEYKNFKEVDGVKYPFTSSISMGTRSIEINLNSLLNNIEVSADKFVIK